MFRYRRYYLDTETNFYYLQSRYYVPTLCRFLNSDLPKYAQQQKDNFAGANFFAYCCNDPVNNSDPTGYKYNPARAKAYANKWWNSTNKKYFMRFPSDCTNFVSQCIYAGGLDMDYSFRKNWYFSIQRKDNSGNVIKAKYTRSWSYANDLYNWLKKYHCKNKEVVCKSYSDVISLLRKSYSSYCYCKYAIFMDFKGKVMPYVKIDHATLSGQLVRLNSYDYELYYYSHTSNRSGKQQYYGDLWNRSKKLYNIRQIFKDYPDIVIYFIEIK